MLHKKWSFVPFLFLSTSLSAAVDTAPAANAVAALSRVAALQAELISDSLDNGQVLRLQELTASLEQLVEDRERLSTPSGSTFWFRGSRAAARHSSISMVAPAATGLPFNSDLDSMVVVARTNDNRVEFFTSSGRELPICKLTGNHQSMPTHGVVAVAAEGTKTDAMIALLVNGSLQAWTVLLSADREDRMECLKVKQKWSRRIGNPAEACFVDFWGTKLKPVILVSCPDLSNRWIVETYDRRTGSSIFEFSLPAGKEKPVFSSTFGISIVTHSGRVRQVKVDKKEVGPFLCDFAWPESARITAALLDPEATRILMVGTADGRLLRLGVPQKSRNDCKVLKEWKIGKNKRIAGIYGVFRYSTVLLLADDRAGTFDLHLVDLESPSLSALARMPHDLTVAGSGVVYVSPGRNTNRVAVAYQDGQTAFYDVQISRRRSLTGQGGFQGFLRSGAVTSLLRPVLLVALGIVGFLVARTKRELQVNKTETFDWPANSNFSFGLTRRRALREIRNEARRANPAIKQENKVELQSLLDAKYEGNKLILTPSGACEEDGSKGYKKHEEKEDEEEKEEAEEKGEEEKEDEEKEDEEKEDEEKEDEEKEDEEMEIIPDETNPCK